MLTADDWNDFAATYAQIQRESRLPIEQDVTATLRDWYPHRQWTIADVAAGSGRYALPLSETYHTVAMSDWAANMLALAREWLVAHHRTNFTTTVSDWHDLPTGVADLVFVSQLPTLTVADLPKLTALTRQVVAINLQTQQVNALITAVANALTLPIPPVAQCHPHLAAAITRWADQPGRDFHLRTFNYDRREPLALADVLPEFGVPITVSQMQALARDLTPGQDPHVMLPVTTHYTFTLQSWHQ